MTVISNGVGGHQEKNLPQGPGASGCGWDPAKMPRGGFSLLEVMLATAILASSALVLSSLLGLGVKFGSRAESRTEALAQAESLLDEFLVLAQEQSEPELEKTGVLNSNPPRGYRIRVAEALPAGLNPSGGGNHSAPFSVTPSSNTSFGSSPGEAAAPLAAERPPSHLMLVTVEIFESTAATTDSPALSKLVKLARFSAPASTAFDP